MSRLSEFVAYLNTLQRCNAQNNNAVAEANYNNPYAADILYKDEKFIEEIINELRSSRKVLLTGFAGDGKTTLAEEIVQEMLLDPAIKLNDKRIRFDLRNGHHLVVIKDLSETSDNDRQQLFEDICSDDYFLLVSNTGAIRKKLLELSHEFGIASENELESKILTGIECDNNAYKGMIQIRDSLKISVFNLVKRDNLHVVEAVFRKILDHPIWNEASESERSGVVYINVQLLKMNDYHALTMLLLIYRRLYEYGHRMTIRNLIEHFVYTLTGNLSSTSQTNPNRYFYNNFFGGGEPIALSIPGIKLANSVQFGFDITCAWKRRIWMDIDSEKYVISLPDFIEEKFKKDVKECRIHPKRSDLRLQTLRMLYFLNNRSFNDPVFIEYIDSFLNSAGFSMFIRMNKSDGIIPREDEQIIKKKVKRVLSEYFLGMKLPNENGIPANQLYIAMTRNSCLVRQTVQVVLLSVVWNQRTVKLEAETDSRGARQFKLIINIDGKLAEMLLPLPFLDYLLDCNLGVMQDPLFSNFQKRLDNLKNQLLKIGGNEFNGLEVVYQDVAKDMHHYVYMTDGSGKIYVEVN